jgi:RND family efflux transporter MFP subunit
MPSKIIILFILFTASCAIATSQDRALVKSVKVKKLELFDQFNVIGQCKNDQSRSYYANISGRIDLLSAKQGDTINAGEIIIAIDKKIAEASKAKAEATFKSAESSYLRDRSLFEKKVISSESLEKSKVNCETARLTLAEAMKTYNDMVITAPFDGRIGVVKARTGDKLNIGDYLFSIVAISPKNVFIQLPESLYSKVSNRTEAIITDTNGNKAKAMVSTVSQYLSDKGTIDAKVIIDNGNDLIHGSYINVELIINKHNGLVVPEQSLLKNDKGNFVYQIGNNNAVKQVYVDLGTRMDNFIEVVSNNLNEGDLIVLEGLTKVQDGSIIELMD